MKRKKRILPGKCCEACMGNGCPECEMRGFLKKPMKRVRVAAFAPGRRKQDKEYERVRTQFMLEHPRCQAFGPAGQCMQPSTECHHRRLRGRFYTDSSTFAALCSFHHTLTHSHPLWGRATGLLLNPASSGPTPPILQEHIPHDITRPATCGDP